MPKTRPPVPCPECGKPTKITGYNKNKFVNGARRKRECPRCQHAFHTATANGSPEVIDRAKVHPGVSPSRVKCFLALAEVCALVHPDDPRRAELMRMLERVRIECGISLVYTMTDLPSKAT